MWINSIEKSSLVDFFGWHIIFSRVQDQDRKAFNAGGRKFTFAIPIYAYLGSLLVDSVSHTSLQAHYGVFKDLINSRYLINYNKDPHHDIL